MFKFGGFKASLNFYDGNRRKAKKEHEQLGSTMSITGAYRTNRDEFFSYNYTESQRKSSKSIVPIANPEPPTPLRQVKSTSNLIKNKNLPPNLRPENPGVSQDPRGPIQNNNQGQNPEKKLDAQKRVEKQKLDAQKRLDKQKLDAQKRVDKQKLDAEKRVDKQKLDAEKKLEKQRLVEQKKLEKQRLEEQKKREKLALQEQAKQEKLKKEAEKKEAQQAKKNKKKKNAAPQLPSANPLGQANASTSNNLLAQGPMQYSTNTLDSSISKSSGPPPYSEASKPEGEKDSSGNVTYSKPVDTGSWDIISKHRENINRHVNTGPGKQTKQTTMDLNFKMDNGDQNKDNSEA